MLQREEDQVTDFTTRISGVINEEGRGQVGQQEQNPRGEQANPRQEPRNRLNRQAPE